MVESVVRAQVDNQMSIQRQLVDETVYIGNYYERQVNYVFDTTTNQVVSRDFIYRKYFYAGGRNIHI